MRWQRGETWQMAIKRKWQILGKNGEFKSLTKYKWDDKKGRLDKWQIWKKIYKSLKKVKAGWQKRHVDNCGLYEHYDIFCETYRRIWQGLRQWDNKQSYWQLAIFTKMANLGKWGIEQESTHDVVKPQMRWQRGEYWEKTNFKYGECAKNSSRVWPNIQLRWQKGAC